MNDDQYIEMCKAAGEIQRKSSIAVGNFWHHPRLGLAVTCTWASCNCGCMIDATAFCFFKTGNRESSNEITENMYWLPRQDQLQEMLDMDTNDLYFGFLSIQSLVLEITIRFDDDISFADMMNKFSIAQLWLIFVMHKKYNKHWDFDKKEWVK